MTGSPTTLPVGHAVTVEVPATSANLGPGFDCFGLALDWREHVSLAVTGSGYQLDVSGEGAESLPRDESHLIIRSTLVGLADLGCHAPGLSLRCHNTIPHGRGLGSSSAAIVSGLLAAAAFAGRDPDPLWLLRHANAIEGHPDNVAAAINGGFVLAYEGHDGVSVVSSAVSPDIGAAVFVPQWSVETRAARRLLPETVAHVDAAANTGRAALLVHAMAGDPSRLYDATHDWLHQHYREPAMPRSYELMKTLRSNGFAAVISGAGPTVLVLGKNADLHRLSGIDPVGFTLHQIQIGRGAAIVNTEEVAT